MPKSTSAERRDSKRKSARQPQGSLARYRFFGSPEELMGRKTRAALYRKAKKSLAQPTSQPVPS